MCWCWATLLSSAPNDISYFPRGLPAPRTTFPALATQILLFLLTEWDLPAPDGSDGLTETSPMSFPSQASEYGHGRARGNDAWVRLRAAHRSADQYLLRQ
jgi:hypothetical protein